MTDIVFEHVTCRYARTGPAAVSDLDLHIPDGELFVLCGASGAGKSTVLRLLAGLVPVTEGRILAGGRDLDGDDRPLVSLVFQNYSIYPNLSVTQNIALPLRGLGLSRRATTDRVGEAASALDLSGVLGRRGAELSAGQRIRVALARGLVRQPAVLLMDEPFAHLEREVQLEMTDLLTSAQARHGITTVYATSDSDEALRLGDRIALLEDGTTIEVVRRSDLDAVSGQRAAQRAS